MHEMLMNLCQMFRASFWYKFLDKCGSAYALRFFEYAKFAGVTAMFTELNLQIFDSLIDKCRMDFQRQVHVCDNDIVQHLVHLHLM